MKLTCYRVDRTGINARCGGLVYTADPFASGPEPAERDTVEMAIDLPFDVTIGGSNDNPRCVFDAHYGYELSYDAIKDCVVLIDSAGRERYRAKVKSESVLSR